MFSWITLENPVAIWWIVISIAGIMNILFWTWSKVYKFSDIKINLLFSNPKDEKNIIWYSMFYVFVCAFRSWFPKADVQRICLWDSWLSSVFLGRTIATVGELAFVFQWTLILRFYGQQTQNKSILRIAMIIFPLICIAEIFSWYAVITTNYFGNSVEESLWAVTYFLIGIALFTLQKYLTKALQLACRFAIGGCIVYVLFMVLVDVPMYIQRLLMDIQNNKSYLGFIEGLIDLNTRWVVTYDIKEWKTEIPWQTLYFTVAVLVSIALCYVPLNYEKAKKYLKINS